MTSLLTLVFLAAFYCTAFAQDTTKFIQDIEITINGGTQYQGHGSPLTKVPEELYDSRYGIDTNNDGITDLPLSYYYPDRYIFDVPQLHGAMHTEFGATIKASGMGLKFSLLAEHRGMSYGVFNLGKMYLVPKYQFWLDTSFSIFGEKFGFGITNGNFDNFKLHDGLMIYNLDMQGSTWWVRWKNLTIAYQKIGDLAVGIGLNVGDANDWYIQLDSIKLLSDLAVDLYAGIFRYPSGGYFDYFSGANSSNGHTFGARLHFTDINASLFAQYGYRYHEPDPAITMKSASAIVAGARWEHTSDLIELKTQAEFRSYGSFFNKGRYYKAPLYAEYYNNARFLYPLARYDQPFSQWAVFTEYQNRWVSCMTLLADAKVNIWKDLKGIVKLDINHITARNAEPFLYPFYEAGLAWEFTKGLSFSYTYTNRAMNLELSYPTLYLYKEGKYMLRTNWNLTF